LIENKIDHVGLVVPKLEPALEELSATQGWEWYPFTGSVITVNIPGVGSRDLPLRRTTSVQGPCLEVIEAVPGSPWAGHEDGTSWLLHHVGFYTDSLGPDSGRVLGLCPVEMAGIGEDGKSVSKFAYHRQHGFRFEYLEHRWDDPRFVSNRRYIPGKS
jgi:hypothetical protein